MFLQLPAVLTSFYFTPKGLFIACTDYILIHPVITEPTAGFPDEKDWRRLINADF